MHAGETRLSGSKNLHFTFRFTFMHLADAFIQSNLQKEEPINLSKSQPFLWGQKSLEAYCLQNNAVL